MYVNYCAPCHGVDGKGNGPVAAALKTQPTNLAVLSKNHGGKFPSTHIASVLQFGTAHPAHGSAEMPLWGPALGSGWIQLRARTTASAQDQQPEPLSADAAGEIAVRSFGFPPRRFTLGEKPMENHTSRTRLHRRASAAQRHRRQLPPRAAPLRHSLAVCLRAANPHPPPAALCALPRPSRQPPRSAPLSTAAPPTVCAAAISGSMHPTWSPSLFPTRKKRLLPVADQRGIFLGTALYSPASQIALRLVSREALDHAAWLELLAVASACGHRAPQADARRGQRRLPPLLQRGR